MTVARSARSLPPRRLHQHLHQVLAIAEREALPGGYRAACQRWRRRCERCLIGRKKGMVRACLLPHRRADLRAVSPAHAGAAPARRGPADRSGAAREGGAAPVPARQGADPVAQDALMAVPGAYTTRRVHTVGSRPTVRSPRAVHRVRDSAAPPAAPGPQADDLGV